MAALTVLMPVCNGARYLQGQLESIAAQTLRPNRLIVSDDGSSDESRAIIRRFAAQSAFPVELLGGPRRGVTANVLGLLGAAPEGMVALADQDDVWLPHRLEDGAAAVADLTVPAIATAPRIVTDAVLRGRKTVGWAGEEASFSNALLENIAPGNTMTLNARAADLARAAMSVGVLQPAHHDWWLSQLVTGAGGPIISRQRPGLFYRQHGSNLFGASAGIAGTLGRLRAVLDGTYGDWLRQQAMALWRSRGMLTPENRRQLHSFIRLRDTPADWWAQGAMPSGHPYRQNRPETMLVRFAARAGCL